MAIAFIRTVILYVVVIGAVRVMGKRQIGELQPSELVVAILISDLASVPMQDTGIPLTAGVIPILTLIACEVALSGLTLLNARVRRVVTGRPSVLIKDGQVNQAEMRRLRYTLDDLMEELRLCGYMRIDEVAMAILETNGKLSVFPTAPNQPVTAGMLNLPQQPTGGLPVTVICDGQLYPESLRVVGKDKDWLESLLAAQGLTAEGVFILTVDALGNTFLIRREAGGLRGARA